jgi:hypothetical protein
MHGHFFLFVDLSGYLHLVFDLKLIAFLLSGESFIFFMEVKFGDV